MEQDRPLRQPFFALYVALIHRAETAMSVIRVNFDTEWEVPVFVNREGFHDLAIDGQKMR